MVYGDTGCNAFSTSLILNDKDISAFSMEPIFSTDIGCLDNELDSKIRNSIESVAGIKKGSADTEMWLIDKEGKTLLILSKN